MNLGERKEMPSRERPILFSAPMVQAILEERKTQTRRIIKPQPTPWKDFYLEGGCQPNDWLFRVDWQQLNNKTRRYGLWMHSAFHESRFIPCPQGAPGDRLWVRETWGHSEAFGDTLYRADHAGDDPLNGWKPSIHMPRWASRILLEITDIRVERLQDISEADAKAEGIELSDKFPDRYMTPSGDYAVPKIAFQRLWESINGPDSWDANPWVWKISFRRLKPGN